MRDWGISDVRSHTTSCSLYKADILHGVQLQKRSNVLGANILCACGVSPQVLLRVKHNEVEYLHKEIMCLRNEVQFLNTVVCVLIQVLHVSYFIHGHVDTFNTLALCVCRRSRVCAHSIRMCVRSWRWWSRGVNERFRHFENIWDLPSPPCRRSGDCTTASNTPHTPHTHTHTRMWSTVHLRQLNVAHCVNPCIDV